jgi:hypothetical protein
MPAAGACGRRASAGAGSRPVTPGGQGAPREPSSGEVRPFGKTTTVVSSTLGLPTSRFAGDSRGDGAAVAIIQTRHTT